MIETISIEYGEPAYITVDESLAGERIDKIISACVPSVSRTFAAQLIVDGAVSADGKTVGKSFRPLAGNVIEFTVPEPAVLEAVPENIPLDIRYEDEDVLVVNKPRGMVVHPAPGNYSGTLVNALLYYCKGNLSAINGVIRPGIVHRIDKDTSGLLLVAKSDFAHISLAEQIKEHSLTREYRAVIHGHLKESDGVVDAPIGRSTKDRKKMCVTQSNSRNAVTHYKTLAETDGFSYVALRLETGRTHQIRVHMAYLGHPVAGDVVYGNASSPALPGGQCLHAGLLGFTHPRTGERIEVRAELPKCFTDFLRRNNFDILE